jgi:signal transduction histidine kinase
VPAPGPPPRGGPAEIPVGPRTGSSDGLRAGPETIRPRGCDDLAVDVAAALPRVGPVRVTVAWAGFALGTALTVTGAGLALADGGSLLAGDLLLGCVLGVSSTLLGAFVVTRDPGNRIGWLFIGSGLLRAVGIAALAWSVRALQTVPGSLPAGAFAAWLQVWVVLASVAAVPMIVVLFPDGRLPSRIFRVVPATAAVILVLSAVVVPVVTWPYRGATLLPDAPVPDLPAARIATGAIDVSAGLALVGVVLALVAVVLRARGAAGEARQQVKWFGYGAVAGLVLDLAGALPGVAWLRALGAVAVLAGIGLGIFRYRLYDVDRLINRTVVYGLVTLGLVGAFAALDVTLAVALGGGSVVVAAGSAFVVALLLRPLRDRVQDLVDRTFDRRRHGAVAIVRALAQQVGREPVEPAAVVAALRRALRDPQAQLYFRTRDTGVLVHADGRPAGGVAPAVGQVADPVRRGGHDIALLVHTPTDPALVHAVVVAGAALVEHARLQAELLVRLAEVRASRARLVEAGDAERRRIERDLHDGAQQRLVGLALHVQSARRRGDHPAEVAELLAFTAEQLRAGVEDIRSLVHGLISPALLTGGLPAALADLARPGEVVVTCDIPIRPDPGVEATAWFVACEGIANATKHAPGHRIDVTVSTTDQRLLVRVSDDGSGGADPDGDGLRNLADRIEARGGTLRIDSPPGEGTRLIADLPCAL